MAQAVNNYKHPNNETLTPAQPDSSAASIAQGALQGTPGVSPPSLQGRVSHHPPLARLWDLVEEKDDMHGGKLLTFRYKEEFRSQDTYMAKLSEVYAAIEPNPYQFSPKDIEYYKTLDFLGYEFRSDEKGPLLVLPDKKALEARFEKYRLAHPELNLNPLKVYSSEGVATDSGYTKAFYSGEADVLLSEGIEFLHDHTTHVIKTFSDLCFCPTQYYEIRKIIGEKIQKIHAKLLKIETSQKTKFTPTEITKLQFLMGTIADNMWVEKSNLVNLMYSEEIEQPPYRFFNRQNSGPFFAVLWERKFQEKFNLNHLMDLWDRFMKTTL